MQAEVFRGKGYGYATDMQRVQKKFVHMDLSIYREKVRQNVNN